MKRLLVLLLPFLLGASPQEASFRVRCQDGSAGSGTAISERVVVTNSHVVGHKQQNNLTLVSPSGSRYRGETISVDKRNDLALIAIHGNSKLPYVKLAIPKHGERVSIYGYGRESILRTASAPIRTREFAIPGRVPGAEIGTPIDLGDSGGGAFNAAGELVGVVWGSDFHNRTAAIPCGVLAEQIEVYQTQCPGQNCWGGYCPPRQYRQEIVVDDGSQMQPVRPLSDQGSQADPPSSSLPEKSPGKGCECDNTALLAEIKALKVEINDLKLQGAIASNKAGPPGPKGDPGPPGPKGDPGSSLNLTDGPDKDRLVDEVTKALLQRTTGSVIVRVAPK